MVVEDYLYIPMMKTKMSKYFTYTGWQSRPTLEQMLNNVSLTLMNAHHAVGVCRPYLPGVIEVGGMHIKEPKPLPKVSTNINRYNRNNYKMTEFIMFNSKYLFIYYYLVFIQLT